MTGHVECGDDVLVGYDCQARLPNGAIDGAVIREPKAGQPGPTAIEKYIHWRHLYTSYHAIVSFNAIWLPRNEAIAQGYLTGKDDR